MNSPLRPCLLLLILLLSANVAAAQFYSVQNRPPNLEWQQIETPRFKIVFPAGADSAAYQTAGILEQQYESVQKLIGGELKNFPVILNNYNDRSNGFVTTGHFRSEIEIPPIKGKSQGPRTGHWLEIVAPHELVHALQFSHLKGPIANIVRLFSPDAARSLHGGLPSGVLEGIAVYHETEHVAPGGGRGHHPFFTNQFNAIFNSDERWSLGQTVFSPEVSRPFDRHYIGGYMFTDWVQRNYGETTTREAVDFYIRWPLLGYGFALRMVTGKWPIQLYQEYEKEKVEQIDERSRGGALETYKPLHIPFKGREVRQPIWISDQELVFYGSFYNARPGFYRYDLSQEEPNYWLPSHSVQDYNYDYSAERNRLLYSYYRADSKYDRTALAELYEGDIQTGRYESLTDSGRLYAPQYSSDGILALQTAGFTSRMVSLEEGETTELAHFRDHEIKEFDLHPDGDRLAVVVNKRGVQGLWIARLDSVQHDLEKEPLVTFEEGAVYDPAWHPDGNRLMFAADYSQRINLFEMDLESETVQQLTHSPYNAFEGSYSPDGEKVAFVIQQENERLPVVMDKARLSADRIPTSAWSFNADKEAQIERPLLAEQGGLTDSLRQAGPEPYRNDGSWLKPRTVLPALDEVSNRDVYQLGASLHSSDLLQQNAYDLELTRFQRRMWYDLSYRHAGFYPGFRLSAFNRPNISQIQLSYPDGQAENRDFLRQERGVSLQIPFDYTLESNVRSSSFRVVPELRYSQVRYFELDHSGEASSDFGNRTTGSLNAVWYHRLQQNIRDMQPNGGLVLFSTLRRHFQSEDITLGLDTDRFNLSSRKPAGIRSGAYYFLSPLRQWNQSLRLSIQGLSQTDPLLFDTQSIVSNGFSEPVFGNARNLLSAGARYTIPFLFLDDSGVLLPFYLSNLYLVAFGNTVAEPGAGLNETLQQSRSVLGMELRARFRISNLNLDLGIGVGYEPATDRFNLYIADF
jgi:Tol biopolymer transport system component